MLNSTNVGDGDYFHTFWQEDIHCRFSHATIAAMCSPLYLIWLGFTMSVVVLSQNRVGGKRSSFLPTFVFRPLTPPYVRFRIRRFLFWIPFEICLH